MDLVERARVFATAAHGAIGQVRKYTGEPYIVHPKAVAELVASVGGTPEMVAAAWLHDVVEDTPTPMAAIGESFGPSVALLVNWLTDEELPGNRATRKAAALRRWANVHPDAKTIKLADLIDNTASILEHDPKFAPVYIAEKRALLEVLRDGDPTLWARAAETVRGEG